jgi:hypothetical protein
VSGRWREFLSRCSVFVFIALHVGARNALYLWNGGVIEICPGNWIGGQKGNILAEIFMVDAGILYVLVVKISDVFYSF